MHPRRCLESVQGERDPTANIAVSVRQKQTTGTGDMDDNDLRDDFEEIVALIDRREAELHQAAQRSAAEQAPAPSFGFSSVDAQRLCRCMWAVAAVHVALGVWRAFRGDETGVVLAAGGVLLSVMAALLVGRYAARSPFPRGEGVPLIAVMVGLLTGRSPHAPAVVPASDERWPGQHEFRTAAALVIAHMEARDADIAEWRALAEAKRANAAPALLSRSGMVTDALAAFREKWIGADRHKRRCGPPGPTTDT